jgi:hypothetical protein
MQGLHRATPRAFVFRSGAHSSEIFGLAIWPLPDVVGRRRVRPIRRLAEYNSAIRRIQNLRYFPALTARETAMTPWTAL